VDLQEPLSQKKTVAKIVAQLATIAIQGSAGFARWYKERPGTG
jgi:hypothetical protein